jgi:hypothetical protein
VRPPGIGYTAHGGDEGRVGVDRERAARDPLQSWGEVPSPSAGEGKETVQLAGDDAGKPAVGRKAKDQVKGLQVALARTYEAGVGRKERALDGAEEGVDDIGYHQEQQVQIERSSSSLSRCNDTGKDDDVEGRK